MFHQRDIRLEVLWCIGIVLNRHCICLASKSPDGVSRTRNTNLVYSARAETSSPFHDNKNRQKNKTVRRMFASKSNHPSDGNGFTRNLNAAKIKRVCRLLERALDGLKEFSKSAPAGGVSKLNDKSSKPNPSLCCCPCGCGGCCLMRPMIMYKVKYTPPKFKMKPLKPKTKCGCPHYGIHLGRKRR